MAYLKENSKKKGKLIFWLQNKGSTYTWVNTVPISDLVLPLLCNAKAKRLKSFPSKHLSPAPSLF